MNAWAEIHAENPPPPLTELLATWFGAAEATEAFTQFDPRWFAKDDSFDDLLRERFAASLTAAKDGHFAALHDAGPFTRLALVILHDQIPRNLFRGTATAFAFDPTARKIAEAAIGDGLDRAVPPLARIFFYLPLEHAEDLDAQTRCCALMRGLPQTMPAYAKAVEAADQHYAIIERFGRFPHRNAALGRATTAEEAVFLTEPGSSF